MSGQELAINLDFGMVAPANGATCESCPFWQGKPLDCYMFPGGPIPKEDAIKHGIPTQGAKSIRLAMCTKPPTWQPKPSTHFCGFHPAIEAASRAA